MPIPCLINNASNVCGPPLAVEERTKKMKASESASALAAIEEDDDDSLVTRFVSRLLKWLLQGFLAKNKIVRYRSVFIVSELISHLGEIE